MIAADTRQRDFTDDPLANYSLAAVYDADSPSGRVSTLADTSANAAAAAAAAVTSLHGFTARDARLCPHSLPAVALVRSPAHARHTVG